jgi:hypothetical protein
MPPRAKREERRMSPIRSYVPEPRDPPAYHAQPGQSTTIQPSGNTASYYPSDPAPIQPAQQPSNQHYDEYPYWQQPQYPYDNQHAYPQPPQERLYDQWGYPQQSQGPYDDQYAHPQQSHVPYLNEYAHLQQAPNPYLTPSTVERTSYRQAPPDDAYDTHASAIPDQPSGEYQQSSQYVPSYSQRGRQRSPSLDLWDLNASQPGSRGDPSDRHRQEKTRTRRSGRDALIGEAVEKPVRATKKPKRRHGSSDIVNVTRALDQASLTAPAYAQGGLEQGRGNYKELRRTTKSKQKSVKEYDIQRKSLPRTSATEESQRYTGVAPPVVEKDPAVVQREKDKKGVTNHERWLRTKAEEMVYPEKREERLALRRLKLNKRKETSGELQPPISKQDKEEAEKVKKAEYDRVRSQKPEVKEKVRAYHKEHNPEQWQMRKAKETERRRTDDPETTSRRLEEIRVRTNETARNRYAKRRQEQREDSPSPRR